MLSEEFDRRDSNSTPRHQSMPDQVTYSVEEANALLPWVVEQLDAATAAIARSIQLRDEIKRLQGISHSTEGGDVGRQLADASKSAKSELENYTDAMELLSGKSILVRDLVSQLIDFPGELNGQHIWLCWIKGDPKVAHWHNTNTGFASRQPI